MNDDDVRRLLRKEAEKLGSQRALARSLGLSAAFVSDVLRGNRAPSGPLLDLLGLERIVAYQVRYTKRGKA